MPHSEINGVIWLLDYLFTLAQNLAWVSFFCVRSIALTCLED